MPGRMNEHDHLWEQGELVEWPTGDQGSPVWVPVGVAGSSEVRDWPDDDQAAYEEWWAGREREWAADPGRVSASGVARGRLPGPMRRPWEVDPVEAASRPSFGWCGDQQWAVTWFPDPRYL